MTKVEIKIGDQFHRLRVVALPAFFNELGIAANSEFICKCECGKVIPVKKHDLTRKDNRQIKSCGCKQRDDSRERAIERNKLGITGFMHGGCGTKLYEAWRGMHARCSDINHISYRYYGGKGISVCIEWYNFENFRSWALSHGYQEGLTLERKFNDGNYCPENCVYATCIDQANNKSNNVSMEAFGEVKTLTQWSRDSRCTISYRGLVARFNRGVRGQKALVR